MAGVKPTQVNATRAKELAANVIDGLGDGEAPAIGPAVKAGF
jgi:hypothetical protein